MKLSLSINLFDGEELLLAMLRSVRSVVDHISIVYQKTSYFGRPCSVDLVNVLDNLSRQGLVDDLIEYEAPKLVPGVNPQKYEAEKRTIGLTLARDFGATHFISLDADEFLSAESLSRAKEEVLRHGYDATGCKLIDYWGSPCHQIPGYGQAWGDYLYVPLIYEIKPGLAFTSEKLTDEFFCIADTTRKLPNEKPHRLGDHVVVHHMTTVRAKRGGILSKYVNRSSYIPPVLPPDHTADLFKAWVPREHWGPNVNIVPDVFNIEASFIEQNLIDDAAGNALYISEREQNSQVVFRGEYDQHIQNEICSVTNFFLEFCCAVCTAPRSDISHWLSEACQDKPEIMVFFPEHAALFNGVSPTVNIVVLRPDADTMHATCVVTWNGGGTKKRDAVRTDTSIIQHLNESGIAARKVVGESWKICGFQELW